MMTEAGALLEVRGLTVTVAGKRVCEALDFAVRPGERWAVLGGNGVGKTTLLHTLAGLRAPAAGTVHLAGAPLQRLSRRARAQHLGLLAQDHEDAFPARVLETALIGRHPHLGRWGWESTADLAAARAALAEAGLAGFETRSVASLSGGERRRLGLATLLAQAPAVLLLDEPTNHLDIAHQIGLLGRLAARLQAEGRAWVMVSHDPTLAARFCDRALLLFGAGEALAGACAEVLTAARASRLYGHPLARLDGPAGPVFTPR
ncbi:iron complex transport system ATP-binding protein [Plasticicumulans lactativorans]|uniref:Iron complex transport system ATP-binding protein n=1 Tax=Plasticicumulans lactativorans TaxID=1133106 RepID=A0A4R2LBA3_9GAMM|nr:ABC transporter ATP-binding protein [Plasticicumulans lactativorans]TCO81658.1 iron complex transport system ATP-binding protein [Plasticicumulans lactativorans]